MSRVLLEHEARALLKEYGLPVADYEFCTSLNDALKAAGKMGYPVVIKIVSPQVVHKSDAGGVRLNIKTAGELGAAYREMMASVKASSPGAEIKGVIVSPYLEGFKELIVGAVTDSQFGPVVMVGLGGVFVEVFKDISFRIAPVDLEEALEMLGELKASQVIRGTRGQQGLDSHAIALLVSGVSEFIIKEKVEEMDLNPVFCFPDRVLVGDARIMVSE